MKSEKNKETYSACLEKSVGFFKNDKKMKKLN